MASAFFFISSGRSGTQWLARTLAAVYPDLAVAKHEPLLARYRGRDFYRLYDRAGEMLRVPAIKQHADDVATVLATGRRYIETGSPSYAALPLFIELFAGEVGLIHLARHPVPASVSLMGLIDHLSDGEWDGEAWTALGLPDPTCPGSIQQVDEASWRAFSPYRRCLYEWTERQLYAFELEQRYPEVPFMRMSSEELFGGGPPALERMAGFLGLPVRPGLLEAQARRVDNAGRVRSRIRAEWREILEAPDTIEVARRLGFDVGDVETSALRRRYRGRLPSLLGARRLSRRARLEQAYRRLTWRVHDLPPSCGTAVDIAAPLSETSGLVLDASGEEDPVVPLLLAQGGRRKVVSTGRDAARVGLAIERSVAAGSVVAGVVGDPDALPFRPGVFDAAVSDRPDRLPELSRVIRPGGRVVLAVSNRSGLDALYARGRGHTSRPVDGYGWSEMERLLQDRFRVRGRMSVGWSGGWKARVASRLVRNAPLRRFGRLIILDLEASS